ncbi:MAG: carbamoyltransferase [Candidatus Omnitrophica bacterium]|nr:carbamoyltransferase [Candidatus Omnitrophota bacterium]MDD5352316.1 carbamoyltransferase [Candidatus Omnitrophota bacterium]MDD5549914.1 carbamoyltransferase [Candidatus Omnitrophota bacterium]
MKDTYILGISAFYHDSAACIVKNGEIIAAAQEERFTRKKHDFNFPCNSINWCLKETVIQTKDLSYVAFYDKPLIKFERIILTYLRFAPFGLGSFMMSMPMWLKNKLHTRDLIKNELEGYGGPVIFTEHHESHAASAFYPSPFKESAILTMDGVGEWATASTGIGKDSEVTLLKELHFPHSLGLLYSAFTYFTGFRVNSGEYKLMGLAPYGKPIYKETILKELLDIKEDGSFKMNMKYFNYCAGLTMTNKKFARLFGGPARRPETKITQRQMDIASSIQEVIEEIMLKMAKYVKELTKQDNLCLGGGVALNCVGNGKILKEKIFKNIWIQPAAGDAGGAIGAALFTWYKYLGNKRNADGINDSQKGSFLGTHYSNEEIKKSLDEYGIKYEFLNETELVNKVAGLINEENVIGWFQGKMEFGPRALGARSIIGDARSQEMQSKMNLKIKFRESFRPFAPSVLKEKCVQYFDMDAESPYMLLVAQVKKDKILEQTGETSQGFDKLKVKRSIIPSVTHVDYSARVQTVDSQRNPLFYNLIKKFEELSNCPVIINTSFNIRGEPIVCTPLDALRCFLNTDMDYLAIGNFLIDKKLQGATKDKIKYTQYLELD